MAEDHAGFQGRAGARFAKIRDLGLFMQAAPHPMADELPDDGISILDGFALHIGTKVAQTATGPGKLHGAIENLLGDGKETFGLRIDNAYRKAGGGVTDPAVAHNTDVELDDITVGDLAGPANTMNDFFV